MKKTIKVEGMTCGHCEKAVKEELRKNPKVLDVQVDLISGKVEVSGDNLEDKEIKEAIDEAGYKVLSID